MAKSEETRYGFTRRSVLLGMGAAAISPWAFAGGMDSGPGGSSAKTPQAALDALLAGNKRFMTGNNAPRNEMQAARQKLVAGQSPFAIVLGCSDSRVPVGLIFDQSLGDVFVVRVAGNIVSTDVLGSIEYAVLHLHSPLIFVLGHEKCGAVAAALAAKKGEAKEPQHITELVEKIVPGLAGVNMHLSADALLSSAVEANVRWTTKQLEAAPEIRAYLNKKAIGIASGVYHLDSGEVKVIERKIPV